MSIQRDHHTGVLLGREKDEGGKSNEGEPLLPASMNGSRSDDGSDVQQRLYESEERFRLMFEQANVGMAFASLDGQLTWVNQHYCSILGYTQEELLQQTFIAITYPDDIEKNRIALAQLLTGETQTSTLEKRYIRRDGSIIWANTSLSLMRDAQGNPLYYMALVQDISQRKQIEEERDVSLQQERVSRQRAYESAMEAAKHAGELEAVVKAMADGLLVYNPDKQLLRVNPAARQILGMDKQPDYLSLPYEERIAPLIARDEHGQLIPEDRLPGPRVLQGEVLEGDNTIDAIVTTLDGREVQLNISGGPVYDAHGKITGGVVIVRDVTARRRLERRTHTALEGLLKMAEALVHLPEDIETVQGIGRRLAELTCDILDCQRVGILAVELETERIRPVGVVGLSSEQEKAWWQEQEQQDNSLKNLPSDFLARMRANEVVVIDMSQPPHHEVPNPYNIKVMLIAPMNIGDRLVGLLTLDYGATEHVYTQNEVALASAVAELSALVIERQRFLSERAEAQGREVALREANRRMEEFLGVASHELRTPLTTIKANVQLAKRRLNAAIAEPISASTHTKIEATQEMLSKAERQVGVLNRLVGDLIDISRIQTGKLELYLRQEPCDLTTIVSEAVQEQSKAQPHRTIHLRTLLTEEQQPLLVIADPDRIAQVLTNYMTNALKYSVSNTPVEVVVQRDKDVEGKDMARVSVCDQGPGLPPEEQKHIWECFYQAAGIKVLSGSGVGLGLGLHISQTIITRHQGHVGVDSSPGTGSTFWFTLPLAQLTPVTLGEE